MNIPVIYYRPRWKHARLNGPWTVSTWIMGWANGKPVTMRFDWYLPTWRLAWRHWLVSAGLKEQD